MARGDVEQLKELTSDYGRAARRQTARRASLSHAHAAPYRARSNRNVSADGLRQARRDHRRDGIPSAIQRGHGAHVRARRDRPQAEPSSPPTSATSELEPMINRPQLRGEDQRKKPRLILPSRRRSKKKSRRFGLVDSLGRRHRDGSLDGHQHSRDARGGFCPQQPRAHRHCADLPGAREGERARPKSSRGEIYRETLIERCEQGVDYLHDPRRRAAALRAADGEARDGHRVAREVILAKWCHVAPP